jgi:hypothetical protein
MDDLKGVLDDSNGHQLLAVVASVSHQRGCQAFGDWACGLSETFDLIAAGRVRQILGGLILDSYVVLK